MTRSVSARVARALMVLSAGGLVLVASVPANARPSELAPKHIAKTLQLAANDQPQQSKSKPNRPGSTSNGINYHGGPVMTGTPNAYVIWYGNWSGSTTQTLVNAYLGGVGGSPYYNINTTYYNGSNTHLSNAIHLAGSTTDNYSQGTALSDAGVQAVVAHAISSGLPSDSNGVYFVLTSADVNETSGFLTQYCGWHTHGTIGSADVKYSFVGDASRNLSACAVQTVVSPNGNVAGDAMISVIAHELEEATSDPDLNAWFDTRGYENADKCAWTFGATQTLSNGAKYNMTIGGLKFLIQRNWVNASGGYCSLSY